MNKYICIALSLILLAGACTAPTSSSKPGQIPTPSQSSPSPTQSETTTSSSAEGALPQPIVTGNSVEICLNSRYSEHSLTGTASNQQIANILWAAGKAPLTGSHRDIYMSTPGGEYLYNPDSRLLSHHSDQGVMGGALMMNCDSDLAFDTGIAYMLATLASVSLWKSSESAVASCPKMSSLFFGVQPGRGLTSELVAHSSLAPGDPGWLPDPATDGQDRLEDVLANLKYVSQFAPDNLALQQISQLLWAGYGCTPHEVAGGRKGLAVPSAMAAYYLTNTVYLINEKGVYRYHNRNPVTDLTTRDHRIEPVTPGDIRNKLQAAVNGLPKAPCYVVICLGQNAGSARGGDWALEEAGFVAANMLVQSSAMGLGCNFKTALTSEDQASIQNITGIPSSDTPHLIISVGGMGAR